MSRRWDDLTFDHRYSSSITWRRRHKLLRISFLTEGNEGDEGFSGLGTTESLFPLPAREKPLELSSVYNPRVCFRAVSRASNYPRYPRYSRLKLEQVS